MPFVLGVGNFAIWSFRFRLRAGLSHLLASPVLKSLACGVANFMPCPSGGVDSKYPHALTLMRGTHVVRSQHHPFRIIPDRGQVPKNTSKPARSEHWGVLHKDIFRSYFANNPVHFPPESRAGAINAGTFTCRADVLAREASRYHVNKAAPWSPVKGAYVIPNRERREKAVILPGEQYACGIGLKLDGANGSDSEQFTAKYASTSAREKM